MSRCSLFRRKRPSTSIRGDQEDVTDGGAHMSGVLRSQPRRCIKSRQNDEEIQVPVLFTDDMLSTPRSLPLHLLHVKETSERRTNRAGLQEGTSDEGGTTNIHISTPPTRQSKEASISSRSLPSINHGRFSTPSLRVNPAEIAQPTRATRASTTTYARLPVSDGLRNLLDQQGVVVGTLMSNNGDDDDNENGHTPPAREVRAHRRLSFHREISEVTLSQDLLQVDMSTDKEIDQQNQILRPSYGEGNDTNSIPEQSLFVDGFSTDDYIDDEQFHLLLLQMENEHKATQANSAAIFAVRSENEGGSGRVEPRMLSRTSTVYADERPEDDLARWIKTINYPVSEKEYSSQPASVREEYNRVLMEQYQVLKECYGNTKAAQNQESRTFRGFRRRFSNMSRGCSVHESSISTQSPSPQVLTTGRH